MSTDRICFCPMCGCEIESGFCFCPDCGFELPSEEGSKASDMCSSSSLTNQCGVLLTDVEALAQKYSCDFKTVSGVLEGFVNKSGQNCMEWHLLDLGEFLTGNPAERDWADVNRCISAFIHKECLEVGPGLSLFIIGGDDVVPIPGIDDPYPYGSGIIPSDMCYSFEGLFLQDMMDDGIVSISPESARNTVARLPLEEGLIDRNIASDLGKYLNASLSASEGIDIDDVAMISNSEWLPASSTMTQHLPLNYYDDDPQMICNGMYVSPKLLVSDQSSVEIYLRSLRESGMLMFNLHGSDDVNYSGFYSTGEAFSIDMLPYSSARVFNTVACFGARYSGYERNESMLLSAMLEHGILLYTGSLVAVPMFRDISNDEARELLLNPGTGSEILMRLYSLYQFKGMPVGLALLRAKCDYFNMCRHVESDEFSMSTILMFSLYGNPMLHVSEREEIIQSALDNNSKKSAATKNASAKFKRTSVIPLYKKESTKSGSILAQVRGAVDGNLSCIRASIEDKLYRKLGLSHDNLESVSGFKRESDSGSENYGYSFKYHNPDVQFSKDMIVEVDRQGNIKRCFMTK